VSLFENSDEKPIAAIATPLGYGGICVVRISGLRAFSVAQKLIKNSKNKISEKKQGTFFYTSVFDCDNEEKIDDVLLLVFHAPHSYTGENTVELQGHGGVVPAERLLNAVLKAGARLAEPGEFTKRAFLNGKLDLTQAEALCDLIQSQTERAAAVAKLRLDGVLGNRINEFYDEAVAVSAQLEHILDFDEGEIADNFTAECIVRINGLINSLEQMIDTWREGELLRQGVLVVLCGAPNAGKSSLLNALLKRNRAIVHNKPGTTRDIIEENYSLNGVPVRLVDTAGLRDAANTIESEGIKRAHALISQADINLLVVDRSRTTQGAFDAMLAHFEHKKVIIVLNKSDLKESDDLKINATLPVVAISALSGEGLDQLKATMLNKLDIREDFQTQPVVNQRHKEELLIALNESRSASEVLVSQLNDIVIAAGHMREASAALGRITGRIYSDDILDRIFSNFCVGK